MKRLNDRERELWVLNTEILYREWQRYRGSMRSYLRKNRKTIDAFIKAELGQNEN